MRALLPKMIRANLRFGRMRRCTACGHTGDIPADLQGGFEAAAER